MAQIEWREEFSVGNDAIDRDHESLIEQINQLYESLENESDTLAIEMKLGDIQADISAHFAMEELLMEEAGFEEYEAHKADHEILLDEINDMVFSFSEYPEIGREILINQISNWFSRHFTSFDARLHQVMEH